jgi:poly(A) polymerase
LGKIANDIDLATPMLPQDGILLLEKLGIPCIPTGLRYGTFTAIINHQTCEITTLRQDITTDGRGAQVSFSSDWQADALRRDLTINALYADFSGKIYDYFQGMNDLDQGIIRFVGEAQTRITEDYLRLLRFFRFYAWYGKHPLDNLTLKICKNLSPKLLCLSKERITKEFLKLMEAPLPLASLQHMAENTLLDLFFYEYNLKNLDLLITLEHYFKIAPDPLRRLAALTNDSHSFRFSRSQEAYFKKISTFLEVPLLDPAWYRFHLTQEKKEIIRDGILLKYLQEKGDNLPLLSKIIGDIEILKVPSFPVRGTDLQKFGIKGPFLGEMLGRCRWWWAENHFNPSQESCLLWIKHQLETSLP